MYSRMGQVISVEDKVEGYSIFGKIEGCSKKRENPLFSH